MKKKTLRVAAAGSTASDGREIKAQWLSDIAETYDPKTYGARCWMEHRRSITNDGFFPALGDVVSVYTQTDKINGKETLCLYATIDALPNLVSMNKDRQKIYTSIEVQPNFAKTDKAYLMGLAFTDSPASLGTEALQFNSYVAENDTHIFSSGIETELKDIEDVLAEFSAAPGIAGFVVDAFKELQTTVADLAESFAEFKKQQSQSANAGDSDSQGDPETEQTQESAENLKADFSEQLSEALKPLSEQLSELVVFKETIESTEINTIKQHDGNGGDGFVTVDY